MSENEFLPGSIRDRIVDLKRKTNVNNKTIAEKTGVSESLLSRIESGKQQTVSDESLYSRTVRQRQILSGEDIGDRRLQRLQGRVPPL